MTDLQVFPDEPFDFDSEAAAKYPEMERLLIDTESADEGSALPEEPNPDEETLETRHLRG